MRHIKRAGEENIKNDLYFYFFHFESVAKEDAFFNIGVFTSFVYAEIYLYAAATDTKRQNPIHLYSDNWKCSNRVNRWDAASMPFGARYACLHKFSHIVIIRNSSKLFPRSPFSLANVHTVISEWIRPEIIFSINSIPRAPGASNSKWNFVICFKGLKLRIRMPQSSTPAWKWTNTKHCVRMFES